LIEGARLEGPLISRDDCTRKQNEPKTKLGTRKTQAGGRFSSYHKQWNPSLPAAYSSILPGNLFCCRWYLVGPLFNLQNTPQELYFLHCHDSAAPCRLNWDKTPVQHGRSPSFCLVFHTSWHPESRYRLKTRHPNHHCRFQARCWTPYPREDDSVGDVLLSSSLIALFSISGGEGGHTTVTPNRDMTRNHVVCGKDNDESSILLLLTL